MTRGVYMACYYSDDTYNEFEFISEHRANSKLNIKDAEDTFKKKTGRKVKVFKTYKVD